MMKKFFIYLLIIGFGIYFIFIIIYKSDFSIRIKNKLSAELRHDLKKYFFPYKYIKDQQQIIEGLRIQIGQLMTEVDEDTLIKQKLESVYFTKDENEEIIEINKKNFRIKNYYMSQNKIIRGIYITRPASLYLDYFEGNLFFLSSIGIIAYSDNINNEKLEFKQIKNNLGTFLTETQLRKNKWFSTKDLSIIGDKIFVSFTNEVKKDCWNTSILYAELNYEELFFEEFFVPRECVQEVVGYTRLTGHQSGGRIVDFDKNNILFSVGDYNFLDLPQKNNSIFGKILKINKQSKKYNIFSMGHRNPQGLFYDTKNNYVLSTEHGPEGGDEINFIDVNNKNIPNYGWPISSYGEHYGGKSDLNNNLYLKYPLFKSHKKYGFIEPIHNFTPSIGISEVVGIGNKNYIVASLGYGALFDITLDKNNQIIVINEIVIEERIRDLVFKNNKIFIYQETTGKIGIIDLKT